MKKILLGMAIGLSFVPGAVFAATSTSSLDRRLTLLEIRVSALEAKEAPTPDPSLTAAQIQSLNNQKADLLVQIMAQRNAKNYAGVNALDTKVQEIDKQLGTSSSLCWYEKIGGGWHASCGG